jgi:uncharacterized protein YjbI with pentapeptide repeats
MRAGVLLFVCALLLTFCDVTVVHAGQSPNAITTVTVGPNVNMGGGPASFTPPSTIIGDPFLQRQNEPSIAVSSRNPCHLLAGANDYRAVDIEEAAGEVGDAWLGVFKSFDCGATWTSTLLPGHKLDQSAPGLASPISGFQAAADPTVRAGTSGLFYYSGIAFNRGEGELGRVFVARFIDNNNKDGADPIQYLGAVSIDQGTAGQFLDKPWIVADLPRNSSTCVINGQTIAAGSVYLVYTSFVGSGNNVRTKILFSRSSDCGATWSTPSKLSESIARNQGTAIALDPGTGAIHIAWREFATASDSTSRNAIVVTRSTDGGRTFAKATRLTPGNYQLDPFDQASSPLTFRTNAYPTIAVVPAIAEGRSASANGRIYVAWSGRGFGGARPSDARVIYSTSINGTSWSTPRAADEYQGAGHQIMPGLAFAGGKLALAYYDLRNDASGGFDDLIFEYGQRAFNECTASQGPLGFSFVYACILTHPDGLQRRHTLDLRAAMADTLCLADGTCAFTSYSVLGGGSRQVSRYIQGRGAVDGPVVQLQYNRPNLPLFSKGRFPFIGDYLDINTETFLFGADGQWAWNTGQTANRPAPVFHVAWSDNRNVGSPRNANWEVFTPPVLGPGLVPCMPGQTGVRNQDVYTAQLRPGLIASAPLNSKRVVGLQRSFVVVARNTTSQERLYQIRAVPPAGVIASFDQFRGFGALDDEGHLIAPTTVLQVQIPAQSSISRTVFVGLESPPANPDEAPDVLVPVHVEELDSGGGTPTGVSDSVFLNPDFDNPDFENPDFENVELHNPDFENPDFENPDFENPDFENFTLTASSSVRNPDFENPDFENPDFENPDFENPDFENPDFENPDFENPDFENPDFENPDFENPDFENPDFENGSFQVSDTTWPVRNDGNTTSAYKANVFVNNPPAGVKYQLVVRKVFPNPAAVCATPGSTSTPVSAQSVPVVNIIGANVNANLFDRNFNDPSRDNATFHLGPDERAFITLRAYCREGTEGCTRPLMASLEGDTALGVVAQGANCTKCTGAGCSSGDLVNGPTECSLADGPPKDIYDPVAPDIDVVNPSVTTPEIVIVATDAGGDGSEPVDVTLNATDNVAVSSVECSSTSTAVTLTHVSGSEYVLHGMFAVGLTGVHCVAYDNRTTPAPNSGSVDFIIEVRDITPPKFADPPFTFASAPNANGWYAASPVVATASLLDSSGVTIDCSDSLAGTTVTGNQILVSGDGIHDITCTATKAFTDPASAATTVRIDSIAPAMTVPSTVVAEATSAAGASVAFTTTATDMVDTTPALSCVPASGALFPLGMTTVNCAAADDAGNTTNRSFVVTVRDTTPPVVTLQGAASLQVQSGTAFVDPGAIAVDSVSGVLPVGVTGTVNTSALGPYVLTYTAADAAGNAASAQRTVTVVDTIAPSSFSAVVTPSILWPPTGGIVQVTISGDAVDAGTGAARIEWRVLDEYKQHQPSGTQPLTGNGPFSFRVGLVSDRRGNDKDGRHYTIVLTVFDGAGNQLVLPTPLVVNVHDQSK